MESTENEEINDWRNEHGEPDFPYLQSLVTDGSVEASDKLKAIASDLNVNYNSTTSAEELMGMIMSVTEKNEDANPEVTN